MYKKGDLIRLYSIKEMISIYGTDWKNLTKVGWSDRMDCIMGTNQIIEKIYIENSDFYESRFVFFKIRNFEFWFDSFTINKSVYANSNIII